MLRFQILNFKFLAFFVVSMPLRAEYIAVTDGLKNHYESAGTGPVTVLLVPGWTMSTEVFERQLQRASGSEYYRLIVIDPRSQGLSTKTNGGNYYEQRGRDLNTFIEAMGLENLVLGGWSNGGFDILSYVHQFGSSKLAGLVMIDAAPAGSVDDNTRQWGWFRKDDADGYAAYFTQGSLTNREALNKEFAEWMVDNPNPKYLDWIIDIANQTSDSVAALLNMSSFYQDYSSDLASLEGKVELLYITNPGWKNVVETWAADNTPSAAVVVMDKHMGFWESPSQFDEPLDKLLNSLLN